MPHFTQYANGPIIGSPANKILQETSDDINDCWVRRKKVLKDRNEHKWSTQPLSSFGNLVTFDKKLTHEVHATKMRAKLYPPNKRLSKHNLLQRNSLNLRIGRLSSIQIFVRKKHLWVRYAVEVSSGKGYTTIYDTPVSQMTKKRTRKVFTPGNPP